MRVCNYHSMAEKSAILNRSGIITRVSSVFSAMIGKNISFDGYKRRSLYYDGKIKNPHTQYLTRNGKFIIHLVCNEVI